MPGLTEALVGVSVVHGDDVHIMEDEAVIVVLLQSFQEASIHESGLVECCVSGLQRYRANEEHNTASYESS